MCCFRVLFVFWPCHTQSLWQHVRGEHGKETDMKASQGLPPPLAVTVQRNRSQTFFFLLWGGCNLRDAKFTLEAFLQNWLDRSVCFQMLCERFFHPLLHFTLFKINLHSHLYLSRNCCHGNPVGLLNPAHDVSNTNDSL